LLPLYSFFRTKRKQKVMIKFGVVTFPGSNCDTDVIHVLQSLDGCQTVRLWHKDTDVQQCDWIILPGGFSYGDYLRSGAIAKFSPIMKAIVEHAQKGGYVLGICNGFQILTEANLLPGALLHNDSHRFICKNVTLKVANTNTVLTKKMDIHRTYTIPIAHGEGRFYSTESSLQEIQDNDQIVFYYADRSGKIDDASNPNGSLLNIAGICNRQRNVFGMMPHPERAADAILDNYDGRILFESILYNH